MKSTSRDLLKVSATSLLLLASQGVATNAWAMTELAKINSSVISLEDFNKKYKDNLKFFQFRAPPKRSVLDDLIKRELVLQEARKMGLDKDPEVLERMNTVLYHALLDKKLSREFDEIHISDDEAKSFYSKNPEIRTSHIFIAVRPDAKPEEVNSAKDRITKVLNDYVKPGKMSFAEIAQRFSEGMAAPLGGDIDYQTRDKLDPAYYLAATQLSVGQTTTTPIRTQFGWHIIKLTVKKSWDDADHPQTKRLAFEERRAQIFEKYIVQLKKQAKVSIHDGLLKE